MQHALRSVLLLTVLTTFPFVAQAQEADDDDDSNWAFVASAGVLASPTYLGDDDTQISIVPNLRVEYRDRLVLGLGGIEYSAIKTEHFRAGPVFRYDFGRDEDGSNPFAISGNDTTDLIGLGDIDGTAELGGFAEYTYNSFSAMVEVRQGVGGHEGLRGEAQVKYNAMFDLGGKDAFLSLGPSVTYGDDDYNSTFFDITAAQSAASGLSEFDADGGLNTVGFEATLFRPLTDKVSVALFADYEQLLGDIADSSLVQERGSENQFTGGVFLNYRF